MRRTGGDQSGKEWDGTLASKRDTATQSSSMQTSKRTPKRTLKQTSKRTSKQTSKRTSMRTGSNEEEEEDEQQASWFGKGERSTTTTPGKPAEKKRHNKKGKRVASKFIPHPKLVEEYYGGKELADDEEGEESMLGPGGMPAVDINNKLRQHSLGLEEALRTKDPWKRMICSITGAWEANAWNVHASFLQAYKIRKETEKGAHAQYVRDIILGGLLESPADVAAAGNPVEMHGVSSTRGSQIDPYVHSMHSFSNVGGGVARQQRCVLCLKEGRRKLTAIYCGLCVTTAARDEERKPTKHAYCTDANRQCFARHVAACYRCQAYRGEIASRAEARTMIQPDVAFAGPAYVTAHPKRMRRGKRSKKNVSK